MGILKSNSGRQYTTRNYGNNAISITDDKGNESVYAFEDDYSALDHINKVENGTRTDAGNFGK